MRPSLAAVSPNGPQREHSIDAGVAADKRSEDPTSMLTERTHQPFVMDDAEAAPDRGMLVFQYMVAAVAVIAAVLLALVN
jgi:hypothetical protein